MALELKPISGLPAEEQPQSSDLAYLVRPGAAQAERSRHATVQDLQSTAWPLRRINLTSREASTVASGLAVAVAIGPGERSDGFEVADADDAPDFIGVTTESVEPAATSLIVGIGQTHVRVDADEENIAIDDELTVSANGRFVKAEAGDWVSAIADAAADDDDVLILATLIRVRYQAEA